MSTQKNRRPAPRRSSLAGASPVAPPAEEPRPKPTAKAEATESHVDAAAPSAAPDEARAAVEQDRKPGENEARDAGERKAQEAAPAKKKATKPKYPPKVSFYQDRDDTDRVRGAILNTMPYEGARTLSQFIQRAVMAEVERLEAKYNGGKPFPPVGARELPQGRPMGE
jgi:hypothetical protein